MIDFSWYAGCQCWLVSKLVVQINCYIHFYHETNTKTCKLTYFKPNGCNFVLQTYIKTIARPSGVKTMTTVVYIHFIWWNIIKSIYYKSTSKLYERNYILDTRYAWNLRPSLCKNALSVQKPCGFEQWTFFIPCTCSEIYFSAFS